MAEFKKLSSDIDGIESALSALPENTILPALVSDCSVRMTKFIARARETDPDKKLYGEQMCAKIEQLYVRFEALRERFEIDYLPKIKSIEAEVAAQRAEEERLSLIRLEEMKRQAVELKRKAQIEEEEKAIAEKEAAERLAAEITRAAEELRLEQISRKKEREEAKLKKEEEEKRLSKEKEAKAIREATEKEEKERAERKRKAESLLSTAKTGYSSGSGAPGGSGASPFQSGVVTEILETSQFQRALLSARDSLVVVDWMAPWCGPCKMIAPHLETLAARQPHVVFLKVDGDKHPDLVSRNQIRAFPTFHFYFRNKLLMTFSGADKSRIEAAIEQHLSTIDDIVTQEAVEASMKVDEPPPSSSSPSSSSSMKYAVPSFDTQEKVDSALTASALEFSMEDNKSALESASMALKVKESLERLANGPPKLTMSELASAASMIERLVDNVLKHPSDPTFRTVKKSNATLVARLLRHGSSGEIVLSSLGFNERVVDSSTINFTFEPLGDGSVDAVLSDPRLLGAVKWLNAAKAAANQTSSSVLSTASTTTTTTPPLIPLSTYPPTAVTDENDPDLLAAIAASLQDQ